MKGIKLFGMLFVILALAFMIAPSVPAQTTPEILDDTWFKVKASLKGYSLDGDTVEGKGAGSTKAFLYFAYDGTIGTGVYNVTTCTEPDVAPNPYVVAAPVQIPVEQIFGETYPAIWNFASTPIVFDNGVDTFDAHAILTTKITTSVTGLKTATIGTSSCLLYNFDSLDALIGIGSCKITGPLVKQDQVTSKVPAECRP
jgi:hypothetical protein